jgi:hypothetical protein
MTTFTYPTPDEVLRAIDSTELADVDTLLIFVWSSTTSPMCLAWNNGSWNGYYGLEAKPGEHLYSDYRWCVGDPTTGVPWDQECADALVRAGGLHGWAMERWRNYARPQS